MLEKLLKLILDSLFLYEYAWFRRGSLALSAAHAVVAYLSLGHWPAPLAVISSQLLFYALSSTWRLLAYSIVVASIPGLWMAGTQALIDAARGGLEPARYLEIYARSIAASLSMLYVLHSLNPAELSYVAYRLGGCKWAYAPLILLRAASEGLREAWEALVAHKLKGVPPWATLAVILLRARESAELLEESYTLAVGACSPRPLYSSRGLALQAAVLVADIALLSVIVA